MSKPVVSTPATAIEGVIASAVELSVDEGKVPTTVLMIPFGESRGRDGRGPYILEDAAHAQAVIAATVANAGSADLMFDYDHQSFHAQRVGGQAKSAGWVKPSSLAISDAGITGDVEWTATAAAALAAREYRYHSPYFMVNKATRRISRLVNAGLTNSPNLDLPALASQEPDLTTQEGIPMKTIALSTLASALALSGNVDEAGVLAAIDTLKTNAAAGEKVLASARTALDLADDADTEAVLAAVTAKPSAEPDPAKYVPIGDLQDVQGRLGAIEQERVTASVDTAIASGKLTPGQKDWAMKLGKSNEAALNSYLATAPAFKGGAHVTGEVPAEKGKLTAEEAAICSATGITHEEFLASRDGEEGAV